MPFEERLLVEGAAAFDRERHLLHRRGALVLGQHRPDGGVVRPRDRRLGRVLAERAQRLAADVVGAGERAAAPDRPVERRGVERQRLLDLVEQVERIARLAVHLVDEGDDRDVAQPADLEQLARARFDALGGVDHHHRRVDRGQGAVGVLGKVLVARRVEQVEDAAAVFEGHHRGDDRDAAFALDAHPVGAGLAAVGLGPHFAGELDRAAVEQHLFGQRRLAGVRVGDDREGAPARDWAQRGHGIFGREDSAAALAQPRGDGKRRPQAWVWAARLAGRRSRRPAHWRAAGWDRVSSRRVRQGEAVRATIASRRLSGGRRDRQARRRRDSGVDQARAMTLGPLRAGGAGHIVPSDDRARDQARRLASRIALGDDGRWIANGCR